MRILMKLRGMIHTTGRQCWLSGDGQICYNCDEGEVEDVGHLLLHYTGDQGERQMERLMKETVEGWHEIRIRWWWWWWWTRCGRVLEYKGQWRGYLFIESDFLDLLEARPC